MILLVFSVDEIGDTRSPAAKCGLKVDDLILQFGSVTLQVSQSTCATTFFLHLVVLLCRMLELLRRL